MFFSEVMDRFVEKSAVSVMFRGTLENIVTAELLDEIFVRSARRQRPSELLFSSIVDLLALVATGSRRSVNDAYRAREDAFNVSVTAVYDKLNGVETEVSRQMVRQTALRMGEVVRRLLPRHPPLLRGYVTKIIDGNHLAATEHRIEPLRTIGGGPLPGLALVVLEPDRMLISDVFPCEDGHAQERSLLPQVLSTVKEDELWIADRNFCTTGFVYGIATRRAAFVIRQHARTLHYTPAGRAAQARPLPDGHDLRAANGAGGYQRNADGRSPDHDLPEDTDPRWRDGNPSLDESPRPGRQRLQRCGSLSSPLDGGKGVQRTGPGPQRRNQDAGLSRGGAVEFLRGASGLQRDQRGEEQPGGRAQDGSHTPDHLRLLPGRGTGRHVPRNDDRRRARRMDQALCLAEPRRIGQPPEDAGRQGPPNPLPQERPRPQKAAT